MYIGFPVCGMWTVIISIVILHLAFSVAQYHLFPEFTQYGINNNRDFTPTGNYIPNDGSQVRYKVGADPLSGASSHKLLVQLGTLFTVFGRVNLDSEGKITGVSAGIYRNIDLINFGLYMGFERGQLFGGGGAGISAPDKQGNYEFEIERYQDGHIASEVSLDTAIGVGVSLAFENGTTASELTAGTGNQIII